MTSIEEAKYMAQSVKDHPTKKGNLEIISHISNSIIQLIGGYVNKNGIGYKIADEIKEGAEGNVTVEELIEAFDVASKIRGTNNKRKILSQIVLTHDQKYFVMQCLYPNTAKGGSFKLGVTVPQPVTFDARIKPMLCKSKKFDPEKFIIERKYDGHRCLIRRNMDGTVDLTSRSGKPIDSEKIREAAECIVMPGTVLDGEIISPNDVFQDLDIHGDVIYKAFDILYLDGISIMDLPFTHRRDILEGELDMPDIVHTSEILDFQTMGEVDNWIVTSGAEGIIAKDPESPYRPGKRDWIKYKHFNDLNADIVGITEGQGKREGLMGAIMVIPESLTEITKVGTGFDDKQLIEISDRIKNGETLKCVVKYQNVTESGHLRFPTFLRLI